MVVTLVVGKKARLAAEPVVLAKGVPVEEDEEAFLAECRTQAAAASQKVGFNDPRRLTDEVKIAVRRVARKWTGKKPMTDVQIIET